MFSNEETEQIRQAVYTELADIERQCAYRAGSYDYLCLVAGAPTFTHYPYGAVLRHITHFRTDCGMGA
jgi:hypothetical protein